MTTVFASLAAVAFFVLLLEAARVGFGISGLPPRARTALAGVAGVAFPLAAYVAVRLLDGAPALRPLELFFEAHQGTGLRLTVPAATLGFALFMGGILHLLLASGPGPPEAFTLGELKTALRRGDWLRTPRWRRRVAITAGVALFACGLFGLGIVLAPAGVKLLLITALLYAGVRTAVAAARA